MSLISLIIVLALVGLITWAVTTYIPMPPTFKRLILIVVCVCVVVWLLGLFGLLPAIDTIQVGKGR